jgi:ABC-type multidrug transport system ATPase subunit
MVLVVTFFVVTPLLTNNSAIVVDAIGGTLSTSMTACAVNGACTRGLTFCLVRDRLCQPCWKCCAYGEEAFGLPAAANNDCQAWCQCPTQGQPCSSSMDGDCGAARGLGYFCAVPGDDALDQPACKRCDACLSDSDPALHSSCAAAGCSAGALGGIPSIDDGRRWRQMAALKALVVSHEYINSSSVVVDINDNATTVALSIQEACTEQHRGGPYCPCHAFEGPSCDDGWACATGITEHLFDDHDVLLAPSLRRGPYGGICLPCAPGYYCPAGTVTSLAAAGGGLTPTAQACPSFSYCPNASVALRCPQGFFCRGGAVRPLPCSYAVLMAEGLISIPRFDEPILQRVIDRQDPIRGNFCPAGTATGPEAPCPEGSYCPEPGSIQRCPKGHFCARGALEPRRCPGMSSCPEGSSQVMNPVTAAAIAAVALILVFFAGRQALRHVLWLVSMRREGRRQQRTLTGSGAKQQIDDDFGQPVIEPAGLAWHSAAKELRRWPARLVEEALSMADDTVARSSSANAAYERTSRAQVARYVASFAPLAKHIRPLRAIIVQELSTRKPGAPPAEAWLWRNSARFLPGKLNAVMGGSGCGKTTMLDLFRGRVVPTAEVTGRVVISCQPRPRPRGNGRQDADGRQDDGGCSHYFCGRGPGHADKTYDGLGLGLGEPGNPIPKKTSVTISSSSMTTIDDATHDDDDDDNDDIVLELPCIGELRMPAAKQSNPRQSIDKLRSLRGFVPQDDIVFADLTVRENLLYSAALKMDAEFAGPITRSSGLGATLADACLALLDLSKVRDNLVGQLQQKRGISGGQRKRTSIGMELVGLPSILLMDEPTSGLDSSGSLKIMRLCRSLTDMGITIIAIVHQPRYACFALFDNLVLLTKYGTVFSGSPGTALMYFTRGLSIAIDPSENPADVLMDIVTKSDQNARDLVRVWRSRGCEWCVHCVHAYPALRQNVLDATVTFDAPARRMMRCLLEHHARGQDSSSINIKSNDDTDNEDDDVYGDARVVLTLATCDEEEIDDEVMKVMNKDTHMLTTVTVGTLKAAMADLHVELSDQQAERLLAFCVHRRTRTVKSLNLSRSSSRQNSMNSKNSSRIAIIDPSIVDDDDVQHTTMSMQQQCSIDDVLRAFGHICTTADLGKTYNNVISRQDLFDRTPKAIADTVDEAKQARAISMAFHFGKRLMQRAGVTQRRAPVKDPWQCELADEVLQACMTLKVVRTTLCQAYTSTTLRAMAAEAGSNISIDINDNNNKSDPSRMSQKSLSMVGVSVVRLPGALLCWQSYVLARRRLLSVWRSPWLLQVIVIVCAAIIVGCIQGSSWSLGSFPGNVAMAMACLGVLSTVTHMRTFALDRHHMLRELDNSTTIWAYHVAYGLVDILFLLGVPILFCTPYYLSLWPRMEFRTMYGVACFVCWYASGLAYLVSSCVTRPEWLNLVGVFVAVIFGAFLNGLKPTVVDARSSVAAAISLAASYNRWALEILVPAELALHGATQPNRAWTILSSLGMCQLASPATLLARVARAEPAAILELVLGVLLPAMGRGGSATDDDPLSLGVRCRPSVNRAYMVLAAWGLLFRILAALIDFGSNDPIIVRIPYHVHRSAASFWASLFAAVKNKPWRGLNPKPTSQV